MRLCKTNLLNAGLPHKNRRMNIHVYMLRCNDGSYYVGLTKAGLDKRIAEHHDGTFEGYTSKRRPVQLVWSQDFLVLTQAIACERRLKGWRREKKEALIRGDYQLLPALARTAKSPSSS
jgi:putative endonuclease